MAARPPTAARPRRRAADTRRVPPMSALGRSVLRMILPTAPSRPASVGILGAVAGAGPAVSRGAAPADGGRRGRRADSAGAKWAVIGIACPAARSAAPGELGEAPDRLPRRETVYRPLAPLDVRATLAPLLRGRSNPCCRADARTGDVWMTTRLGGGATLVIRAVCDGARAIAWGPGGERAIDQVPELLGRGDDWAELEPSLAAAPWLAEARRRHPGLRLPRTGAVLEQLAPAILEQKITAVEAHRAWAALHRAYADPAPGPEGLVPAGMTLPLSAEQWRGIPPWAWHRAGVDRARSSAVLRAAARAPGLERTLALGRGGEEITGRLRSIPGVGVWTAAETTQRAHGDPDAPSFGDYHLAKHVGWAFTGADVDDDGMRELLEPWRGHRQRIVRLALLAGRRRPRGGPRMTIEDHRAR